jgi:hypothetical protein
MHTVARVYQYAVSAASDSLYGLVAFQSTPVIIEWTSATVEIDQSSVSETRVDVNTYVTISFHCRWSVNQSVITSGSVYLNGSSYSINSTGWVSFTTLSASVTQRSWVVTSVDVNGIVNFTYSAQPVSVIWDRILVESAGATETSVTVSTSTTIYFVLRYEYDLSLVTDGTVSIGNYSATYSTANQRWEASVSQATTGQVSFTVTDVSGNTNDITVINHDANPVDVEWVESAPDFLSLLLENPILLIGVAGAAIGVPTVVILMRRPKGPKAPKQPRKMKVPKRKKEEVEPISKEAIDLESLRRELPSYDIETLKAVKVDLDRMAEKYDKIYAGIPQKLAKSKEAKRIGNLLQQIHDIRLELESELDRRWVDSL